jgi:hypothetical protein
LAVGDSASQWSFIDCFIFKKQPHHISRRSRTEFFLALLRLAQLKTATDSWAILKRVYKKFGASRLSKVGLKTKLPTLHFISSLAKKKSTTLREMANYAHMAQLARSKPAAALLALATHYVLHNGEWDNSFHVFLGVWTVGFTGLAVSQYAYDPRAHGIIATAKVSAASAAVYFGVLMASIFIHRAFFHRLRNVRIGAPNLLGIPLTDLLCRFRVRSSREFPSFTAFLWACSQTTNTIRRVKSYTRHTRLM